jgi:hypothetical protein
VELELRRLILSFNENRNWIHKRRHRLNFRRLLLINNLVHAFPENQGTLIQNDLLNIRILELFGVMFTFISGEGDFPMGLLFGGGWILLLEFFDDGNSGFAVFVPAKIVSFVG